MDNINNSTKDENTFWNYVILLGLIAVIWYIFFYKKENFQKINSNSVDDANANKDKYNNKRQQLIQKINKTSIALENFDNNNDLNDTTYPNLNSTKPFSSNNMVLNQSNKSNQSNQLNEQNQNKTADGSTKLMNEVGFIDGEKVACNLLGVNSANMDAYKKKFYSMYAHQIECPAKCSMKENGMTKGCGMGSKCGLNRDCSNVNTLNSIPDTFALNHLALTNANKKDCVSCNFKPTSNPLNREWLEKDNFNYDELTNDVKTADEARLKKMNLIDANVSNYANFKNNVYQDSVGESAPDRINEIRTCQNAYGTCSLKDYGTSIANAYDKLTANPAYTSRNNCNPYSLTGVLEDASQTSMYANV